MVTLIVIIIDYKRRERSPVLSVPKHPAAPFPPSRRPRLPPGSCGSGGSPPVPGAPLGAHGADTAVARRSCTPKPRGGGGPGRCGVRVPPRSAQSAELGGRGGKRKREALGVRERFRTGRESGKELQKSHRKPKILRRKITQIREHSVRRLPSSPPPTTSDPPVPTPRVSRSGCRRAERH